MPDTPAQLLIELTRSRQADLAGAVNEAMPPGRPRWPVARARWRAGQVIIRTGEAIAGTRIAALPRSGAADEHVASFR